MRILLILLFAGSLGAQISTYPQASGGGSATPGGASGAVQFNNAGALGGNTWVSSVNGTAGGAYLSATNDTNGGAPNVCPIWYWGDTTCVNPSALLLSTNLNGNLVNDGPTQAGLSIFGNFNHTGTGLSGNLMGSETRVYATGTGPLRYLYGADRVAQFNGGTTLVWLIADSSTAQAFSGSVTNMVGDLVQLTSGDGSTVTNKYGVWVEPRAFDSGTATNAYMFYSDSLGGQSVTNPYYSWYDSRGVLRVKEDSTFDGVGQAIQALYNPQFAKYTPGATDFERVVLGQWNGNVAEIGTQAGGTGVLRPARIIGASVDIPEPISYNGNSPPTNSVVCYKAGGVLGWASNTAGVIGTTCN